MKTQAIESASELNLKANQGPGISETLIKY